MSNKYIWLDVKFERRERESREQEEKHSETVEKSAIRKWKLK